MKQCRKLNTWSKIPENSRNYNLFEAVERVSCKVVEESKYPFTESIMRQLNQYRQSWIEFPNLSLL